MDMTLEKKYAPHRDEDKIDPSFPFTSEMLKSLCFNCDNRPHCKWKEERKIYCEHFE